MSVATEHQNQTRTVEKDRTERTPAKSKSEQPDAMSPAPERGQTSIADSVVSKIAGIAARDVPGVYALGTGAVRAFAAMRNRVPGGKPSASQGVDVEVGEKQCAVDLAIVAEYGTPIAELAANVRENVITSVERMSALDVVEVNISVDDIHVESEEDTSDRRVE